MIKTCPNCGKTITKKCPVCGRRFETLLVGGRRFCSRWCYEVWQEKNGKPERPR